MNIERLASDGVDTQGIRISPQDPTGSAFVTYHPNGERDFIFNIKNSASGKISADDVTEELLKECRYLHIMGSSLFSFPLVSAVKKATSIVKANGGIISFDPNIRKEMLDIPEMRDALHYVLELADIFLPSESEVTLLSSQTSEDKAITSYLNNGIKEVIIKRGNKGASYYSLTHTYQISGHQVVEIDPTGAGDCFGGAYIACRSLGYCVEEAIRVANACGAIAVTRRGPMEGASSKDEVIAFLERHEVSIRK